MRIRKKTWARPELSQCAYFTDAPQAFRGAWGARFGAQRPLWLDLGCGKCVFLAELARRHPEVNVLGVDISYDILGVGRRNIEAACPQPQNVQLAFFNIERLPEMLSAQDRIERIYINFCNPWPKKKHHKRRLTYPRLLAQYRSLLAPAGEVWFKTDDDALFEASLCYFEEAGYEILAVTRDLHAVPAPDNILSEHEILFAGQGIRIKALRARPAQTGSDPGKGDNDER